MRNKYPGLCYECGKMVEKGQGHFERVRGGWRVKHAECVNPVRSDGTVRNMNNIKNEPPRS